MHELGIVFHVQDALRDVAEQNNLSHLAKVTLELGEVSGVVPSYLLDCWTWACKKESLFEGCELLIEEISAQTHCDACGHDYETVAYGKTCPNCNSQNTWLVCGNEVMIKEVEGL